MAFGYHLMLDMYECRGEAVHAIGACYQFLDALPGRLGMSKQSPPFLFRSDGQAYPDKAGLSGWVPLIESGIQIHTLEPVRFVSLDVYSCRAFDPEVIRRHAAEVFAPAAVEVQFVLRGRSYQHPAKTTYPPGVEEAAP